MRVRVLGPIAVDGPDGTTVLRSPSQRLILAVLAVQRGLVVDADRLVDALWPDGPPATATHTLRTYVSRLRHLLGDPLAARPGGYALDLPPDEVDLDRFERLVATATDGSTSAPAALAAVDDALALWRGPAFADLGSHPLLQGTAVRLDETRWTARVTRLDLLIAVGRPSDAVAAAEELLAEAPLREAAWAALAHALVAGGREADAVRAVGRAREALAEVGLEPSPRLARAEAAALGLAAIDSRPVADMPRASEPIERRNQPVASAGTSFVGREHDLAAVTTLLDEARIVTLVGPGGVGKTRLATEATRHGDGPAPAVHVVRLSGVAQGSDVASFVADALGFTVDRPSPLDVVAQAGGLDALIVLDNCEHVIDAAADVAAAIVRGGDRARVLATSRERLAIDGECVWPVRPLAVDDDGPRRSSPAVDAPAHRLFVDRLAALAPTRSLDEGDHAVIDRITARLDGLPLAVEMAAARAATLPLPELAERLDRLDDLGPVRRDVEPRHRTLRALVAWSEALLDDDLRRLLAELRVFAAPAAADDIAAVTGRADALPALCALAERSLVVADPSGPTARFGLLTTVREHVAGADGDDEDLRRRHADHVAEAVGAADAALASADEADAHRRLEGLLDEARAAHRWARRHDPALAARLSAGLHLFAQSRLRGEPLLWAVLLLDELDRRGDGSGVGIDPGDLAATYASAAQHAVHRGDLAVAVGLATTGIELGGTTRGAGLAGIVAADTQLFMNRPDGCAAASDRVLAIGQAIGDTHLVVEGRLNAVLAAAYAGDHATADRLLAEADVRPLHAPTDRAWVAYGSGEALLDRDPDRALARLHTAIELADSVGNRYVGGIARVSACSLQARHGDVAAAVVAFRQVIEHWRREHLLPYQLTTLRNLVVVLRSLGLAAQVAELVGCVTAEQATPTFGDEATRLDDAATWAAGVLGPDAYDVHLARGAARTIDEQAAEALTWLAAAAPSGQIG